MTSIVNKERHLGLERSLVEAKRERTRRGRRRKSERRRERRDVSREGKKWEEELVVVGDWGDDRPFKLVRDWRGD